MPLSDFISNNTINHEKKHKAIFSKTEQSRFSKTQNRFMTQSLFSKEVENNIPTATYNKIHPNIAKFNSNNELVQFQSNKNVSNANENKIIKKNDLRVEKMASKTKKKILNPLNSMNHNEGLKNVSDLKEFIKSNTINVNFNKNSYNISHTTNLNNNAVTTNDNQGLNSEVTKKLNNYISDLSSKIETFEFKQSQTI